jgi:uncharacterized protein
MKTLRGGWATSAALGLSLIGIALPAPSRAASADEFPPLNSPPTTVHLAGKFIWADLFTTDPALAAKFYEAMFGWTPAPLSRDGRTSVLLQHDGRPVAGIVERPSGSAGGSRARWVGYVAVDDVTRTSDLIAKFGGKVLAPVRDFPARGAQAIVADNEGAVFGLLHSASGDPEDYQPEIGEWIWTELLTIQPEVAAAFYRNVFAYDVTSASPQTSASPNKRSERFILASRGFARASVASLSIKEDSQPAWLGYVRVTNVDKAADKATAFGGRVEVTPRLSQLGTRFAVISDPVGGVIAMIEFNTTSNVAAPR